MRGFVVSLIFINVCYCMLWKKGVVYFTINKLDYDIHSQDEITSTLSKLQDEICIKFFQLPPGNQTGVKLLFITNPDKIKNCQPNTYDFGRDVVSMPIGYKCLNEKAIARLIAEMLRASIEQTVSRVNSYDLVEKFREKDLDPSRPTLLSAVDRNFINAHYNTECGSLAQRVVQSYRRHQGDDSLLTDANVKYYKDKLWPLGIIMYGVEETLRDSKDYKLLRHAMTSIELSTCVVFEEVKDEVLIPKNLLWFGSEGGDTPLYGFQQGNQLSTTKTWSIDIEGEPSHMKGKLKVSRCLQKIESIKLDAMVHGAPGHTAHALNNILRALGIHMMSNRFDRDNYVTVNWKNVVRGKERLLVKAPKESWLEQMAYDFNSASHAPANFACKACGLGATTVQPLQDLLWQKTISIGHRTDLSESDVQLLKILYAKECRNRFSRDNIKE